MKKFLLTVIAALALTAQVGAAPTAPPPPAVSPSVSLFSWPPVGCGIC